MNDAHIPYQQVFNADLVVGTQYSDILEIPLINQIGVQVDHPSTASTTYGLEVSNHTMDAVKQGTAKFFPWDEGATLAARASTGSYGWSATPPFNLCRVRAVSTVASGASNPAKITICAKQR